jgi:hypothetical protein
MLYGIHAMIETRFDEWIGVDHTWKQG